VVTELRKNKIIPTIWDNGRKLQAGIQEEIARHGLPAEITGYPPEFSVPFKTPSPETNIALGTLLCQEFARRGVFWGSVIYVLYMHRPADIKHILGAAKEVFALAAKALKEDKVNKMLKVPPIKPLFRRRLV
jgi:glutamate-1-semialdehyde aminotransferase